MSLKPEAKLLPSRPFSRRARWSTDSWAWEILSCTISITATVAVAIILFIYDEKFLPKMPYNIGLNSVVSILGTVSKSALLLVITSSISQFKWLNYDNTFENGTLQDLQLHDEASRGPWGSAMLLVNWKGLSWAKLGALVTVLSLAFDPMYQTLITIEQRPWYQNNPNATAKRIQSFEDVSGRLDTSGTSFEGPPGVWTLGVVDAIFKNTSVLETDPSCPTGTCTFPVFSFLGFCSNCIDITQSLQQNSNCTLTPLNTGRSDNRTSCTYRLPPSSSGLNYSYWNMPDSLAVVNGSFNISWAYGHEPSFFNQFLSVPDRPILEPEPCMTRFDLPDGNIIPSCLAPIALIKMSPLTGNMSTGFVHTAHICALSICAREYYFSVTSGLLLSETVSTSYSNSTQQLDPGGLTGNLSYTFTFPTSTNGFTFIEPITPRELAPDRIFYKKIEDMMNTALHDILKSNPTSYFTSNMLQTGLNASIDITKTMDRVAAAMSNSLRDLSSLNVHGQSVSMELYVRVSWPWLALPVLSVMLGMILLISVMKVTRKHKMNIWKTSELALLFHGLDFSLHDTAEMDKVSEMEEIAMALQVRLGHSPRGGLALQRKREVSGQNPPPCKNATGHPQLASSSTVFSHDAAIL